MCFLSRYVRLLCIGKVCGEANPIQSSTYLNILQLLTVSVLLTRVCRIDNRRGHGLENRLSEQFLTYAGVRKTLLVMAFFRGLGILGRLDEVFLTAPTGCIHAALGVGSFEDGKATFQSLSKSRQRLAPIIVDSCHKFLFHFSGCLIL